MYAQDSPEFSNRMSFKQVTKLTVHPRLQLILQSEPVVWSKASGQSAIQIGGVAVGAQAVLFHGENTRPTISASYFRSVYSGPAPDIDIGSANQSAVLLVSEDFAGFHFDANGIANEQKNGVVRRAQWGQTLSVSHPFKKFTFAGEIWHFSQPLQRGNTIGNLWAVSYAPRGNLIFDVAFNHGRYKELVKKIIAEQQLEFRAPFLQKGDVLFWNAKTIHGSLRTTRPQFSRSSLTSHFIPASHRFLQFQSKIKPLKLREFDGMAFHCPKDMDRLSSRVVLGVETTFPKTFQMTKKLAIKALVK